MRSPSTQREEKHGFPLIVDLDGTLLLSDALLESGLAWMRRHLLSVKSLMVKLWQGKANLKQWLAKKAVIDVRVLPYNQPLIEWLQSEKAQGRKLVLCTASDQVIADKISEHLGLFDEVMASDGHTNLSGHTKAQVLLKRFVDKAFDYVGNSRVDLAVWRHAREAVVVSHSQTLLEATIKIGKVTKVFDKPPINWRLWRKTLRIHQWLKNSLLMVPMLAAHLWGDVHAWATLVVAFFSFSLCASTVYIANDLIDIENDRQHPRKKNRPFASGAMPIGWGLVAAPILLTASLVLGSLVNLQFLYWLVTYFVTTTAYSFVIKKKVLIDCLTLAFLYTLRLIAGGAAVDTPLSFWLLAFAVFLFLSLALVKRYAELKLHEGAGQVQLNGRGYQTDDLPLIEMMGIGSGFAAVEVLALYFNSQAILNLYQNPTWIWGTVPVMLFWINWVWLQAHRGQMDDDPLVFATKDRSSLVAGGLFALFVVLGTVGFSW